MNNLVKVAEIKDDMLVFDDGSTLSSYHNQECRETHYLDFEHNDIREFEGLDFDLSCDNFFARISEYGITLLPENGHCIRIPGYGSNNGYYNGELALVLKRPGQEDRWYGITDCQYVTEY